MQLSARFVSAKAVARRPTAAPAPMRPSLRAARRQSCIVRVRDDKQQQQDEQEGPTTMNAEPAGAPLQVVSNAKAKAAGYEANPGAPAGDGAAAAQPVNDAGSPAAAAQPATTHLPGAGGEEEQDKEEDQN